MKRAAWAAFIGCAVSSAQARCVISQRRSRPSSPRSLSVPTTLTGVARRLTREQIRGAMASGTGRMPAFATALGDSSIEELTEYLVSGKEHSR